MITDFITWSLVIGQAILVGMCATGIGWDLFGHSDADRGLLSYWIPHRRAGRVWWSGWRAKWR